MKGADKTGERERERERDCVCIQTNMLTRAIFFWGWLNFLGVAQYSLIYNCFWGWLNFLFCNDKRWDFLKNKENWAWNRCWTILWRCFGYWFWSGKLCKLRRLISFNESTKVKSKPRKEVTKTIAKYGQSYRFSPALLGTCELELSASSVLPPWVP